VESLWEMYADPASGAQYYFNPKTEETQWENPW
jgi:hypothetical protein